MKNWYLEIDKKLLPKQHKLKGADKTGIKNAPFFLLISGRSGLGKTNALVELLHRQNGSYDKIILCCMSFASDPLYVAMKKKNPAQFDIYEKEVPSPDEYIGEKGVKLIIFDDMVGKKQFEKSIDDWFVRGRKSGASMVFITQSFYGVNTTVRRSLSNLYLFPSSNKRELAMILREYPFLDEYSNVVGRYIHITKEDGPSDFMNLNIQRGTACINFDLYDTKQIVDQSDTAKSELKSKRKNRR